MEFTRLPLGIYIKILACYLHNNINHTITLIRIFGLRQQVQKMKKNTFIFVQYYKTMNLLMFK
jgi:hypothetical protein